MAGMGGQLSMTASTSPEHARRRFAVIGSPITHSLSPVLHAAAYRSLGATDASYGRYEVGAGQLESFLRSGPGRALHGVSVTMPGKGEAFTLADETDAVSAQLQISNTLIRRPDGRWRAENHDVHGIVASLRDHGVGSPSAGGVLGSGATALSAVAALVQLGAQEVRLSARNPDKLTPLRELAETAGAAVRVIDWEQSHQLLATDTLISALATEGAEAVSRRWADRSDLARPGVFLDVLYDPWPAPLAKVISARGGEVADGLEMLAHQAAMQVRSMLGVGTAPVAEMLGAARRAIADG